MSGAVSGFSVPSRPAVPGGLAASSALTPAQRRYGILPMPAIAWTPEVEKATAHLYEQGEGRHPRRRVALLRALRQGDQRAEGRSAAR